MATTQSSIEILRKAQELDREIYQASQAIENEIPAEKLRLKQEQEAEKARLKELEEALKAAQLRQKQKESTLADKEANIRKMDGQLSQVKTNKEYAALQQEIASLKADNSLLEEEIIRLFDEVSTADAALKAEKERLQAIEKKFSVSIAELAEREKKYQAGLDGLKKSRQEILAAVPEDVRQRYDLIISKKQGLALVKIKGENCGACHYQLRQQVINEVRIAQSLVFCENCARILYCE